MLGQAATDAKEDIAAADEVIDRPGHYAGAAAQGQGMGFGKGAFAQQGGHHRGLEQFGQFNQFGIGLGVKGTLAGVDYRIAGIAQGPGRRRYIGGIALGY